MNKEPIEKYILQAFIILWLLFITLLIATGCTSIAEPTCTWMPADTTDHAIIQIGVCI